MSLPVLGLLFTLGVLVHNTEEALFLPKWSVRAGKWHAPVSARQFVFAVSVLSALLVAFAIAAFFRGPRSLGAYLFAGYVFAMVANALLPHVLASVALRSYMPGTATALLLNVPLGSVLLYRLVDEGYVQWSSIAWVAPLVAAAIAVSIPVLFWVAAKALPQGTSGQSPKDQSAA